MAPSPKFSARLELASGDKPPLHSSLLFPKQPAAYEAGEQPQQFPSEIKAVFLLQLAGGHHSDAA